MSDDLTTALLDCMSDLRAADIASRPELRLHAGMLILQMQEQLDQLDYAYALQMCELRNVIADAYKQLYIASTRRKLAV